MRCGEVRANQEQWRGAWLRGPLALSLTQLQTALAFGCAPRQKEQL